MTKPKGRLTPSRPPPLQGLRPRQQRFADEYLVDLNAKQAAIRAGYSPKTAEVQGCQLLRVYKVAAYVAKRQAERLETNNLSIDRVLEEVRRCALADPRAYFNGGGQPKALANLTAEEAAPLTFEIRRGRNGKATVKIKLLPKTQALEQLCRRFGLGAPDAAVGHAGVSVFELPPGTEIKIR